VSFCVTVLQIASMPNADQQGFSVQGGRFSLLLSVFALSKESLAATLHFST